MNQLLYREIRPEGWLRRQLEIQAAGLSGNLDKLWPDVRDSAWIGGSREGWERVPYWLDGFIPLAHLLKNPDLMDRANRYVQALSIVSSRMAGSAPARRSSAPPMICGPCC